MPTALLNNPYDGLDLVNTPRYKSNLHTHTNQSDGSHSVGSVIEKYHEKGYKILALTDHDNMRTGVTYPWSDFQNGTYELDPAALGMLAIKGTEISAPNHIGSYFNDITLQTDEEQGILDTQNSGGISVINHPGRYERTPQWYVNLYAKYPTLVGMEVYNQRDRYPNDRCTWDDVNRLMPTEKTVWGLAGDDMHTTPDTIFKCYNHLIMPELTEAAFRHAFVNGHYFLSCEKDGSGNALCPVINDVIADEDEKTITLTAADYTEVRWIDHTSSQIGEGLTFNYEDFGGLFIRAEVVNEYGVTNTQPFRFEQTETPKTLHQIYVRCGEEITQVSEVYVKRDGEVREATVGFNTSEI